MRLARFDEFVPFRLPTRFCFGFYPISPFPEFRLSGEIPEMGRPWKGKPALGTYALTDPTR
ncbi:MAG TPA: hypothetical protein VNE59_05735 [Burkholderiales bacterium]|nr:hypothetical protein [Burkholderiales bacterium]